MTTIQQPPQRPIQTQAAKPYGRRTIRPRLSVESVCSHRKALAGFGTLAVIHFLLHEGPLLVLLALKLLGGE